ncbi:MAG TPA: glutamine synthetase family protein [Egibacteraceae bacterium]|nr:glutamine synthetase family protein [Egibacteraceae bacterium]
MRGEFDLETCRQMIASGDIDTVLVVFPDLQGRLVGKRVTGHYFLDEVIGGEGIHACDYLLTVDVDMEPLPGYRFASWDTGYGDVRCAPDLTTLRLIPWLEKTALVICDVFSEEGPIVEVSPRQILKRQIDRARALGYTFKFGSELEFFLFRDSYEEAGEKGYSDLKPHAGYIEDYHILQTTKDEYFIRQVRNGMDAARVPVEFSKGEWGRGQHEINLVYADALEMADRHVIYKNGIKEIAALNGLSVTFMAKYSMEEAGSSCHIHTSIWNEDGTEPLNWDDDGEHHFSDPFRWFLGGLVSSGRELAWMYAPYVNSYKRYQPESWAPTALAWGHDNRTCGYRLVGHGPSMRIESRIPGADANPYLAFAATIAAALHGITNRIDPPAPFKGNAYESTDVERVPWHLLEAVEEFSHSEIAAKAFGDDVHHHLLNTAQQEWARFNQAITDWERQRNFERI